MEYGQLADYFEGVGAKQLSAVDAEPKSSNQHEVGTTLKMRGEFLGVDHKRRFDAVFIWLGQNQDGIATDGWATHYDTRLNRPRPPEWRLYYPSNMVTEAMKAGDTLFLAKDRRGRLFFIVAPNGSTSEQQLCWLFGLRPEGARFVSRHMADFGGGLDFAARYILGELGIDLESPDAETLDREIERFGNKFPPTTEFSRLARETLPDVRANDNPDAALLAWLEREEALFLRLERRVVAARLEQGFVVDGSADVGEFIRFSSGVHNRRKARMGYSLEHHIAAALDAFNVMYTRSAVTEKKNVADFLFPSADAYHASSEGDVKLTMLGAKSTCKDRWRQVLNEAKKIPRKHLLTLEPGISEAQTDQMEDANLQLVVPASIQASYTQRQRHWLCSLREFIDEVLEKQDQ